MSCYDGFGDAPREKPGRQWTHVYCPECKNIQPSTFDELAGRDVSGEYEGADIVCDRCKLIVCTMSRSPEKPPASGEPGSIDEQRAEKRRRGVSY